ncbi:MAG: hypothetical protein PWP04_75 [Candidatus Atribacteria bacterium]|nr:hypothetical protein [Candidatus Atribacteria bacterium]
MAKETEFVWEEFQNLSEDLQKFMEHILKKNYNFLVFSDPTWKPACDLFETATHFVILVELAGVSPQEVEVFAQGKKVVIKGERKDPSSLPKKSYYQMEISFGPFYREIDLPGEIRSDAVQARFRNGFLIVECLKKESQWERKIPIE